MAYFISIAVTPAEAVVQVGSPVDYFAMTIAKSICALCHDAPSYIGFNTRRNTADIPHRPVPCRVITRQVHVVHAWNIYAENLKENNVIGRYTKRGYCTITFRIIQRRGIAAGLRGKRPGVKRGYPAQQTGEAEREGKEFERKCHDQPCEQFCKLDL